MMNFSFIETMTCDSNSPCPALYECIQSVCTHKSPFPPTEREIFGSFLFVFLLGMANVGGMGGAFIASPILMTIFNFDPIPAIRITYCMIFCGAIGNFITVSRTRRPNSQKPAIDYDVAILCIPVLVSGASIGVIANSFLPPVISLSFLTLLCLHGFYKFWKKAIAQYRLENTQKDIQRSLLSSPDEKVTDDIRSSISTTTSTIEDQEKEIINAETKALHASLGIQSLNVESAPKPPNYPLFPLNRYLQIIVLLLIVVAFLLLRGSKTLPSIIGVEFCGGSYWMIYFLAMAVCFIFSFFAQYRLKREKEDPAERSKAETQEFDVRKHPLRLSMIAFRAGILGGFAGVGGGLILNPVFLDMGMAGPVTTATTNFFVLFTAFISVAQTAIGGALPLTNGVYFGSLSFVGAMVIASVLKYIVKKYNRTSLVLFLLCFVTLTGAIVVSVHAGYRMITGEDSKMMSMGSIC